MLCPKTGLSVFDELHSGRRDRDAILYAFDLIELNGDDLRREPLEVRKATLIATGSTVGYDRLLLATASLAFCFFTAWFWTSPSSA